MYVWSGLLSFVVTVAWYTLTWQGIGQVNHICRVVYSCILCLRFFTGAVLSPDRSFVDDVQYLQVDRKDMQVLYA